MCLRTWLREYANDAYPYVECMLAYTSIFGAFGEQWQHLVVGSSLWNALPRAKWPTCSDRNVRYFFFSMNWNLSMCHSCGRVFENIPEPYSNFLHALHTRTGGHFFDKLDSRPRQRNRHHPSMLSIQFAYSSPPFHPPPPPQPQRARIRNNALEPSTPTPARPAAAAAELAVDGARRLAQKFLKSFLHRRLHSFD